MLTRLLGVVTARCALVLLFTTIGLALACAAIIRCSSALRTRRGRSCQTGDVGLDRIGRREVLVGLIDRPGGGLVGGREQGRLVLGVVEVRHGAVLCDVEPKSMEVPVPRWMGREPRDCGNRTRHRSEEDGNDKVAPGVAQLESHDSRHASVKHPPRAHHRRVIGPAKYTTNMVQRQVKSPAIMCAFSGPDGAVRRAYQPLDGGATSKSKWCCGSSVIDPRRVRT